MNTQVDRIKNIYKTGMRIKLHHMNDVQAPPPGTEGTIKFIDDMGDIHVAWDNGSGLALIPGEDSFSIIG